MERLMIQLPTPLKRKLDALRTQGYTASGYTAGGCDWGMAVRRIGGVE